MEFVSIKRSLHHGSSGHFYFATEKMSQKGGKFRLVGLARHLTIVPIAEGLNLPRAGYPAVCQYS